MIQENATKHNTFAVIAQYDTFGAGYLVQSTAYLAAAIADGWQVLVENRSRDEAEHIARIYKYAGKPEANTTPVLNDLLTYNHTEQVEERDTNGATMFDTVYVPMVELDEMSTEGMAAIRGAVWVEGVVTDIAEDTIELDGYLDIDRRIAEKYGEIIVKADTTGGFMDEYAEWIETLNQNMETCYAIALYTSEIAA